MHYGFVTFDGFPALYEDELPAVRELEARGHRVTPVDWEAPRPDGLDALVMRNPWNWFKKRDAFRAYLESLRGSRVVNDAQTMRAFADKTYLPRLEAQGLPVVPSVQLTRETLDEVPRQLHDRGWTRAVLKPAFTANAYGAHRFDAAQAVTTVERVKAEAAAGEVYLLQPFIPSVAEGERSFVFFGGAFSHAVQKVPPAGEWRVQHEYGGKARPFGPKPRETRQAAELLEAAAPGTTYARVDCVEWNGRLHLMELEVVEPELFFRTDASAPARFATALEAVTR